MSYYRNQLENWLKDLDIKADLVYDIGGGQGNVKGRTKSWQVKEYAVLDLPEYNIDIVSNYEIAKADLIFCLEVFEYLIDPITAMGNIYNLLKPGGKAYITFAFVYPHHNELELDSLRYTENGIKRIAERVGLSITNTWYRIDRSGLLQSFYATDGMRTAKEYTNHNVTGFICEVTK